MKIKRLVGGNLESNGYLLYEKEGGNAYLVDPGYQAPRFLKEIDALQLHLQGILLTHHHYDHVGAVDGIVQAISCPVYLHRDDCDLYGKHVDRMLENGDTFLLGDETLTVLHTPGHTRGSVCFFCEKSKVVFTGDTIFNVDLGRTDLADGSPKQMRDSIRNTINRWGNDMTLYPGHGDPANMKYVRKYNHEFLDLL